MEGFSETATLRTACEDEELGYARALEVCAFIEVSSTNDNNLPLIVCLGEWSETQHFEKPINFAATLCPRVY